MRFLAVNLDHVKPRLLSVGCSCSHALCSGDDLRLLGRCDGFTRQTVASVLRVLTSAKITIPWRRSPQQCQSHRTGCGNSSRPCASRAFRGTAEPLFHPTRPSSRCIRMLFVKFLEEGHPVDRAWAVFEQCLIVRLSLVALCASKPYCGYCSAN